MSRKPASLRLLRFFAATVFGRFAFHTAALTPTSTTRRNAAAHFPLPLATRCDQRPASTPATINCNEW